MSLEQALAYVPFSTVHIWHTSYLDWHYPMPPLLPAGSNRTKDTSVFALWPGSHRFSVQVAEGQTDGPVAEGGITGAALGQWEPALER